ncbi:MAG: universal stress protein, partial [Nitrospira sp.]|nr:universal stress protein [Nitrospira sp.]MBH0185297.1 universal stress protein [Nitrospira sp.]
EIGSPAQLILDSADSLTADLIVVGTRGRSCFSEIVLGSVSHRVLLHSSRPTLITRGAARTVHQVLVAIEDRDDADRVVRWLTQHPFATPVELRVIHAVVPIGVNELYVGPEISAWLEDVQRYAEELVQSTAGKLVSAQHNTVTTKVIQGSPAAVIEQEATDMDLVIVTSHGRKGISRFLLGSVSHAVVHHVTCPVLVLR